MDSHSALSLCKTLRELAKKGHCVIVVIHQPSAECFTCFDTLWLLSQGKFVFNGPLDKVSTYFDNLGYACPTGTNIADHLITCINFDELNEEEVIFFIHVILVFCHFYGPTILLGFCAVFVVVCGGGGQGDKLAYKIYILSTLHKF